MPNLPVNSKIRPHYSWSIVLLSGADNHLINVFTRLDTKVGRRLINEYKCLMNDSGFGNQKFMKFLRSANIGRCGYIQVTGKLIDVQLTHPKTE